MYIPFLQISMPAADTASAGGPAPVEKTLSIWNLATSGGIGGQIIMLTLLIFSIITVAILIERYNAIKRANKTDSNFMNHIKDHVANGKLD